MHLPVLTKILFVFSFSSSVFCKTDRNKIFDLALNGDNSISLHWMLNYAEQDVTFELHVPSGFGWFAFGFSDRGNSYPADYCLLWKNIKGKFNLLDTWANQYGVLEIDKKQDCINFNVITRKGVTKFTFKRKFDTCDPKDYIIEDGTTHIVWARGFEIVPSAKGLNISTSKRENHGMTRVTLLKNIHANTELPSHLTTLNLLNDKVKVPAEETTYWCKVFKLPEKFTKKHHIYQYGANIQKSSEGLVHHMEMFHCETKTNVVIPLYNGNCFASDRPKETMVCKRVLAAWAMGALPFTYPEEAALPLGGVDFNPYVMLEIHYNNPELRSGFVDSSGITFHVSDVLRDVDAGVIELGLEYTDKMAIPPGQESFPLVGYCISSCTSVGLPAEGITIFGSQLHTHLTGVKVFTRHFDAFGRELPELNRDNHFSTHFQEIRRLKQPVKVLPGDVLITRCDYNTMDRTNATLGGFSISEEMCVNYIHYYPHTALEVCKSSISDQALDTFFHYLKEWENQPTSASNGVSSNYNSIEWNKMRVQLLDEVYHEAPLSMQCNMSSGDRFPGYWENAPLPAILAPLPPPERNCHDQENAIFD
ncbi:tyramine beta-hydroxylase [Sitophilus oryzae]|uniref:Tyramine beta-hydroxylase n=1 Tax=Sitophilus oryzae TaxID=7048 RepID=A0A6J2YRJ2_SITOR|nr:tyramine beta-hydroxylase [Sitophilus oryzae]